MPTYQIPLTGTPIKIANADSQRTVLTIANLDSGDECYISDDRGEGATYQNSYPIFPRTYISLERKQGDEPQKAWYGVMEAGKTARIAILSSYGDIVEPVPIIEPHPQQPYYPKDAPKMRII